MNKISIKIAKKTELSSAQIELITNLINTVYENSEREFWPTDGSYSRTTLEEINNFIENEELLIAQLDKEIVGSVHVYAITKNTLGFGMLTSSLKHRNKGIGNLLLDAVETYAKTNMYSNIQLELLKPVLFKHPEKEFLEKWYSKKGYVFIETISHENLYFKHATMLKFPCKFDIFMKHI